MWPSLIHPPPSENTGVGPPTLHTSTRALFIVGAQKKKKVRKVVSLLGNQPKASDGVSVPSHLIQKPTHLVQ